MENGLERIRQGMSILKPSERKVSEYILDNPKDILHMPIAQLSKKANASEATIIRMCRSLHFKGYSDLKLSIAAALPQKSTIEHKYQDISGNSSLAETISQIASNNIYSIKNTLSVNDEEDIKKVIQDLNRARRIAIIGVGASAIVALDFEQKLKRINKWCEALVDSHSQLVSVTNLNEEDVLFAISYSGETKEIINTVNIAKENDIDVISLTEYSNNTLQKLSNHNLFVSSTENFIRSAATASRISQLTIVDIIFTGLASIYFDESVKYLDKTREVISRFSK
ncbi:MurR/RpiR family transcriptional regulator [Robertmurraya massiliosenegalensis]|uniref:MurR/RpiR family transcriptional regulator n=1 Tax=Robertmurraya TaxID=2837507 RepID=UPI0039A42593